MQRLSNHLVSSILFILIFMTIQSFAQLKLITDDNVITEGNIYKSESGELFTDAIVVNFKENVIDLSVGKQYATKSNIKSKYLLVTNLLNKIESEYSSYKLIKQIPSAQWGNTKQRNKITGKEISIHEYSQLFTIRFDKPVPLQSLIEKLKKLDVVEYVHQPVTILLHTAPPNDQYYNTNDQWYLFAIGAEGAWDISTGSSSIKIGIIDSGTDQDHPDLADKIAGGDLVEHSEHNYHGTYVSGVAGAKTNNSIGIASLGWNLKLNTYGYSDPKIPSYIANDIVSATSISDIINMSFGTIRLATYLDYYESMSDCPDIEDWMTSKPWISESFPEIQSAVQDAITQGVVCIASAGNASKNATKPYPELCDPLYPPYPNYPSDYPNVISVSGSNQSDNFVPEYNFGNNIAIAAPAKNIYTTAYGGGYISKGGTSFSAPQVSALAGLIKSVNSGLSASIIRMIITSTADKVGQDSYNNSGWNQYMGYGRINAHNALNVTNGKPHKPQYLKVAHYGGYSGHPQVTWFTNPVHPIHTKFNTKSYKIYRSYEDNGYRTPWRYIGTVNHNSGLIKHSYIDNGVTTYRIPQSSIEWFYRVVAISNYLNYESLPSNEDSVYGDGPIEKRNSNNKVYETIKKYKLFDNYPNPFNPSTIINYSIPQKSLVILKVYDTLGKEVKTLVSEVKAIGTYSIEFIINEQNNLSSGIYLYRIEVFSKSNPNGYFSETKRMILLK